MPIHFPPYVLPFVLAVSAACLGQSVDGPVATNQAPGNPYRLTPFHADFPGALEYPPMVGREYDRTRRQMLERLVANLAVARREAWQMATEFFWRAPEDAVDPLIAAMDEAMGNPALGDVVKNTVEAMGKMANPAFDGALRRALQHKSVAVVQATFGALAMSGKVETLRELAAAFPQMDSRSRTQWLRGVRLRLGAEAVPLFRAIMDGPYTAAVRDQVLKETLQLPADQAAQVLQNRWLDAVGEFKAVIAGVLHANDDVVGTTWLRDSLQSEDLQRLGFAIKHCTFGELGALREPLLRTTTHLSPEIRAQAAMVLTRVPGDDVGDVFEVLAGPEQPWEIRSVATRELVRRGRGKVVDVLLDEVGTATGVRLQGILSQLTASGDPRAVPILVERFEKAPEGEGRPFLQSLAQNGSVAAAEALLQLLRGPERLVGKTGNGTLTTRNYLPTLLLNLRGSERTVLAAFQALPRDEWRLRALLLPIVVGIAADREDPALTAEVLVPLRAILFDPAELPQLRVLALNQLARRWLTIEDALRLKNARQQESAGMRLLFGDFLLDMF